MMYDTFLFVGKFNMNVADLEKLFEPEIETIYIDGVEAVHIKYIKPGETFTFGFGCAKNESSKRLQHHNNNNTSQIVELNGKYPMKWSWDCCYDKELKINKCAYVIKASINNPLR